MGAIISTAKCMLRSCSHESGCVLHSHYGKFSLRFLLHCLHLCNVTQGLFWPLMPGVCYVTCIRHPIEQLAATPQSLWCSLLVAWSSRPDSRGFDSTIVVQVWGVDSPLVLNSSKDTSNKSFKIDDGVLHLVLSTLLFPVLVKCDLINGRK